MPMTLNSKNDNHAVIHIHTHKSAAKNNAITMPRWQATAKRTQKHQSHTRIQKYAAKINDAAAVRRDASKHVLYIPKFILFFFCKFCLPLSVMCLSFGLCVCVCACMCVHACVYVCVCVCACVCVYVYVSQSLVIGIPLSYLFLHTRAGACVFVCVWKGFRDVPSSILISWATKNQRFRWFLENAWRTDGRTDTLLETRGRI